MPPVIVVGAGHAAGQLVAGLRQNGSTEPVHVFGDEHAPPYQRPPLSKQYLSGEWGIEKLLLRPVNFYAQKDIHLHTDVQVVAIDRAAKSIRLASGESHAYSHLVLATGSRVRKLGIPGSDLGNVFYLRTVADVDGIRAAFAPGRRLVIVGGGYIGLETAAVAKKLGLEVTVLEMESRILQRVTTPEMSAFYDALHREHGIDIRVSTRVTAFSGTGPNGGVVDGVVCGDGEVLPADVVIVGVGVIPNTELAADAGLAVDNGIVVDAGCRTEDPSIYAIGDCARGWNDVLGRAMRIESVPNAMEQARVAAGNICGKSLRYAVMPWFWSDQYDIKLQMVGYSSDGTQQVLRGNVAARQFMTFYLADGAIVAADSVNMPREFLLARQLAEKRVKADAAMLADPASDLKSLLPAG
jgi:3-phenylpropionate/trans-cinnamate dioxygenase ferredoxin reductase subunit